LNFIITPIHIFITSLSTHIHCGLWNIGFFFNPTDRGSAFLLTPHSHQTARSAYMDK
jgi:hypothetical protein